MTQTCFIRLIQYCFEESKKHNKISGMNPRNITTILTQMLEFFCRLMQKL